MKHFKRWSLASSPKDIWRMFHIQLQAILHNKGAIIIVLGLCILPSLYAWFNIAASWDPYGQTGQLKVAVSNDDSGINLQELDPDFPLKDAHFNAGERLVHELKADRNFDWQFVDHETAINGVKTGTYYAAIVLPDNFSKDLTSFATTDVRKASIDYYVNEKINAISPKITGTGITVLQGKINETFIKILSESVLNGLAIGDAKYRELRPTFLKVFDTMEVMQDGMQHMQADIDLFQQTFADVQSLTEAAQNTLPNLNNTLRSASDVTLQAQNTLQSGKKSLQLTMGLLEQEVNSLPVYLDTIQTDFATISRLSDRSADLAADRIQQNKEHLYSFSQKLMRIRTSIDRFNAILPIRSSALSSFSTKLASLEKQCDGLILTMDQVQGDVRDGRLSIQDATDTLQRATEALEKDLSSIIEDYNLNIAPELYQLTDQITGGLDDTYTVLQDASGLIPKTDALLGDTYALSQSGYRTMDRLRPLVQSMQDLFGKTVEAGRQITDDEKINTVMKGILTDVNKQSDFFSEPVVVDKQPMYQLPNYGSAMAPFYTVLALWVGALLLMSIVSTVNNKGLTLKPTATVAEMYFSRMGLYLLIATCQALIVSIGNLVLLHVYCVHPLLFIGYCVFISHVFVFFVFSLVFTFGEVGKALAIVTLVLQISASGGTFPVEMMPRFFQNIHPLLPFTYAIGCIREVMAGIYTPHLITDTLMLCIIPITSMLMVLVIGRYIRKYVLRLEDAMHRSGL